VYDCCRQDPVISYLIFLLICSLLLVGLPTAIVYRRNQGKLSLRKSYLRATLHMIRVIAWFIVGSCLIVLLVIVASLAGAFPDIHYPWWSILAIVFFTAVAYGIQRLMRYILNDPDWNNMFISGDR
jgi:hypothetical protein